MAGLKAANASALAVNLANRPVIDIEKVKVGIGRNGDWALTITWKVYNAGQVPARFLRIGSVYYLPFSKQGDEISQSLETIRGPGRGFDHQIYAWGLSDREVKLFDENRLVVEHQIRVQVEDPFGVSRWHLFTRRLLCGPDTVRSELINNATRDWSRGYRSDRQDEPNDQPDPRNK